MPKRECSEDGTFQLSLLQSNLMNTRYRKTYEAVAITIQKPIRNAQVSQGFNNITLSEALAKAERSHPHYVLFFGILFK